jgi:hypothetical protein
MWNYIQTNQATVTVANSDEGIKKVLASKYAFLIEYVYSYLYLSSIIFLNTNIGQLPVNIEK